MEYIDYDRRYRAYGKLGFPHAERVYFYWIAHEFGYISNHQKLLDIGYLLMQGYDIRADIHNTYLNHPSVQKTMFDIPSIFCLPNYGAAERNT